MLELTDKVIARLARAIKHERFAFKNKTWFGFHVVCEPLFCSYGKIGYSIIFYDERDRYLGEFDYDWDMDTLYLDEENENLLKIV